MRAALQVLGARVKPDRLATFESCAFGFDTETHKIQPGLLAPPLVVGSIAGGTVGKILNKADTRAAFLELLDSPIAILVGANIAYDMLVMATDAAQRGLDIMPQIFGAYADGRVFDVQIAEALHAVACGTLGNDPHTGQMLRTAGRPTGRYSLENTLRIVTGREDAKGNDTFRTRYAFFDGVPFFGWEGVIRRLYPDAGDTEIAALLREALQYPVDDAVNQRVIGIAQATGAGSIGHLNFDPGRPRRNLHDHSVQVFKAWCLHLGAARGVRTDPALVAALEAAATVGRTKGLPEFQARGWIRADGSEDGAQVREAVALAYGADPLGQCEACEGARRVPGKTSKGVTCTQCNGTGLDLTGVSVPRSEPSGKFPNGQIRTGRDFLVESGEDSLMSYAAYQEDDKILDTYIPFLRQGAAGPITLRPNPILSTGRVSYEDVIQLLPRAVSARLAIALQDMHKAGGPRLLGVRDCIVPRPGHVFYSVDFTGGELVTFAESCVKRIGFSEMGKLLIKGADVHSDFAAQMLGQRYDDFVVELKAKSKRHKNYRQTAKPANFGFPGGMAELKLVHQQRASGPDTEWPDGPSDLGGGKRGYKGLRFCLLMGGATHCGLDNKIHSYKKREIAPTCAACIECARDLRAAWFKKWPEAKPYLDWHSRNVDERGEIEQLYSGRVRGGADFCAEANGDFQGLLADITGRALIRVCYEQYVDRTSILYGNSAGEVFAHDELLGEARIEVAPECAERVCEIMIEEFRKGCPNHVDACRAEPTLMPRWYKAAECVRDDKGRLQVWQPT